MPDTNRRRTDGDETWFRLREWTKDQKPAERMSAQILQFEGFSCIDPTHPLGGKDGAKDIVCFKNGVKWIGAVYFPRGQKSFREIKKKFNDDFLGVEKNNATCFVFITNQEIKAAERTKLVEQCGDSEVEIYHLERMVHILNSPANYAIRYEYLDISISKEENLSYLVEKDKTLLIMMDELKQLKITIEKDRNERNKETKNEESQEEVVSTKLVQNNIADSTIEILINNVSIPEQLHAIFKSLNTSVNNEATRIEFNEVALDEFEIVRLHLFSHSMMYKYYTTEKLGNHSIHLLYKHRERIELNSTERNLILETVLNDRDDLLAGWYWLDLCDRESCISIFIDIAYRNQSLRKNIFNILKRSQSFIPKTSQHLIEEFLSDKDNYFVKELLEYCALFGEDIIIPYLQLPERHLEELNVELEKTKLCIMSRSNPLEVLEKIIQSKEEFIPIIVLENSSKVLNEISDEMLTEGVFHPNVMLRSLFISETVERKLLSQNSVDQLFQPNHNMEINYDCIYKLIKNNIVLSEDFIAYCLGFEEKEQAMFELYCHYAIDTLKEKIKFYSLHGDIAYKVLAMLHFQEVNSEIRKDIEENFQRLEQETLNNIKRRILDHIPEVEDLKKSDVVSRLTDQMIGQFDSDTAEFIKNKYIAASLCALSLHGIESDVEYARKLITSKHDDIKLGAIQLLEKFGDSSDLEVLLETAESSYGKVQHYACKVALKIQTTDSFVINRMLNSKKHDVVSYAINYLINCNYDMHSVLYPLLFNDEEHLRVKVLAYYSYKFSEDQLKLLLEDYANRESHYYNVVCWLDRILFAPEFLRQSYKKSLLSKIEITESKIPSSFIKYIRNRK